MSTITSIPPTAATTPITTAAATTTPATSSPTIVSSGSQTLTQADFLKIMVAQFTQQDPLASGDSGSSDSGTSDYVNELMSMTNLTTMQTISSQDAIQLASTLPGASVQLSVNGATVSGAVQNASIDSGTLYVTINGTQYPASDLIAVTQTAAQAQAAAAAAAGSTTSPSTTPASN